MKTKISTLRCIALITLFAAAITLFALAMPDRLAASTSPPQHTRYRLIDLGTLGGPNSFFNGGPPPMLNNGGVAAGEADTSTPCSLPDPFSDGFVSPAFMWQRGTLINLGLLPGGCWSLPNSTNARGMIVGSGDLPVIDPLTGLAEIHADFFYRGQVVDMGTLGGAYSLANMNNNRGQACGFAENTNPDPFVSGFSNIFEGFPGTTSFHAFMWEDGVMTDLGTLGGPDSAAFLINDAGDIAGVSFTNDVPNPTTGIPTADPFLWQRGTMTDLGTLGGTIGSANALNNRGQVVGFSDLAGDLTNHAFIWQHGVMTDLGTLGGDNSTAHWINEAGQVVGNADLADGTRHAFVWSNGRMTDLGTVDGDPCSSAGFINDRGQVIGRSTDCHGTILHVFLWESGSLIDLSSQVLPGSGVVSIFDINVINEMGEIAANGVLANGDVHAVILQPHGRAAAPGETEMTASQSHAAAATPRSSNSNNARFESSASTPLQRIRNQMRYQYQFPRLRSSRQNYLAE